MYIVSSAWSRIYQVKSILGHGTDLLRSFLMLLVVAERLKNRDGRLPLGPPPLNRTEDLGFLRAFQNVATKKCFR